MILANSDRPILNGCGDLINDFKGIGDFEEYRDDLVIMYFANIQPETHILQSMNMVSLKIRNMILNEVDEKDRIWVKNKMEREFGKLASRNGITGNKAFSRK